MVTFNQPVVLPGAELRAGTYIFELANPHVNLDLVRVSSRDRSKVYLTTCTRIIERPAGMPASIVIDCRRMRGRATGRGMGGAVRHMSTREQARA